MKKWMKVGILTMLVCVLVSGCSKESAKKDISLSANEIIAKIYDGIKEDQLPALMTTEVTEENMEYYLGVKELEMEEAVASEPMMSSIAHSVVVVKMKEKANIEEAKKNIQKKVNPAKWICVEAEKVIVESRGNTIILIMSSNALAPSIQKNFQNLK